MNSSYYFYVERILEQLDRYLNLYQIKGHLETKSTSEPLEHHSRISSNFPLWLGCRYFLEPDMYCKFFHICNSLYYLVGHKMAVFAVPEINILQWLGLMGK